MITQFLSQMPVLLVVLPLLAAPVCVIVHRAAPAWFIYALISWACFAIAFLLFVQVRIGGPISYILGGWPPPFGIELRLDALNMLVVLLVTGIAAIASSSVETTTRSIASQASAASIA